MIMTCNFSTAKRRYIPLAIEMRRFFGLTIGNCFQGTIQVVITYGGYILWQI